MKKEDFDKVFEEFADEVNLAAKRELGVRKIGRNRSYGVASRTLQKSLEYSIGDGSVRFGSSVPYAAFLHWGVNGTRTRQPGAPYSFKYENPSKSHVDSIYDPKNPQGSWMTKKPVRLRQQGTGRFRRQTPALLRSVAWLIARSIKRNGIVGLRYYSVALESMLPQYQDKLGEALANDIVKSFEFTSGNITFKIK